MGGAPAGDERVAEGAGGLVKMNDFTFAITASSSRFSVPVMFVSMNSWRLWVATCGLCKVAVWRMTFMPRMDCCTKSRLADGAGFVREFGGEEVDADGFGIACFQLLTQCFAQMPAAAGDGIFYPRFENQRISR